MSRPNRAAAFVVLALLLANCASLLTDPVSDSSTITIIGTNDFHGALLPGGRLGGLAVFSSYVDNLRATRDAGGGAVLLIDAGDMWQGTLESNLSEGASVVRAYNEIGYTAAAIGNHEFDYGPAGPAGTPRSDTDDGRGALKARAAEANFPILAANLIDDDTGIAVDWPNVSPSILIEVAGIQVGVVGVLTERALFTTLVANTKGLSVAPLLSTIRREATALRHKGAEIVIVSAHAGSECTEFYDPDDLSSCNLDGEIFRLAKSLPAGLVDVIVAGHVHKGIAHNINGISIISSYSSGQAFGRVDLEFSARLSSVASKTVFAPTRICEFQIDESGQCGDDTAARVMYSGAAIVRNGEVAALLEQAAQAVRQFKNRDLGVVVESAFDKAYIPESPLGNLLTDILLDVMDGADVAIHNTVGGVRAGIPAGPLTFGRIYEMFPFDNRLVKLSMDGASLRKVFAMQFQGGGWRAGVSGITVIAGCEGSQLVVTMRRHDGSVVTDDDTVTISTNDFLATGGDGIFTPVMPDGGFEFDRESPTYRDEIVSWMERRGGTLRETDFYDAVRPRFELTAPPPISCANAG